MTDEYRNLDLDTADELLIAAGRPELAQALRYQTQGVRNLVQGEWGQSFVNALDNIMETRVINVLASVQQRLDQQIELVQQILTAHKETVRGLKKANSRITAIDKRHEKQWAEAMAMLTESKQDRADLRQRIDALGDSVISKDEHAALLAAHEALVRRVEQLEARGDGHGSGG